MDWNSVGVQNENQWLLSWGFINYRSNYQVTINLYSWSGLVWFNHLWHLQMGEARPRGSVQPSINSMAFLPAKVPWKKFRSGEGAVGIPPPPPPPAPIWILSVCRNHRAPKLRLDLLLLNVKIIKFYYFFLIMGFKEWGHRYRQSQRDSIISRALHGRWLYTKIIKITKRTFSVHGYSMISSRL